MKKIFKASIAFLISSAFILYSFALDAETFYNEKSTFIPQYNPSKSYVPAAQLIEDDAVLPEDGSVDRAPYIQALATALSLDYAEVESILNNLAETDPAAYKAFLDTLDSIGLDNLSLYVAELSSVFEKDAVISAFRSNPNYFLGALQTFHEIGAAEFNNYVDAMAGALGMDPAEVKSVLAEKL
ncbi:MAG: hypothetical protein JW788_05000, partial [Candidatus Omnitrophica bacterium]|nr:hypothetical protein [Candidatus Omnitrophota bacterium]